MMPMELPLRPAPLSIFGRKLNPRMVPMNAHEKRRARNQYRIISCLVSRENIEPEKLRQGLAIKTHHAKSTRILIEYDLNIKISTDIRFKDSVHRCVISMMLSAKLLNSG